MVGNFPSISYTLSLGFFVLRLGNASKYVAVMEYDTLMEHDTPARWNINSFRGHKKQCVAEITPCFRDADVKWNDRWLKPHTKDYNAFHISKQESQRDGILTVEVIGLPIFLLTYVNKQTMYICLCASSTPPPLPITFLPKLRKGLPSSPSGIWRFRDDFGGDGDCPQGLAYLRS